MAKNGARGSGRVGAVKGKDQRRDPVTGLWTKRCDVVHSLAPNGHTCPGCGEPVQRGRISKGAA